MKILIADKVSPAMVSALEKLGAKVALKPELSEETLPSAVADTEILIVRSTKVKAATIEAAPNLSLIIRAGAGVNTIDIAKASERGVCVANCPGKNNDAVAELALGLLISADRRIPDATTELRSGKWNKKEFGKARGLKGRTLGIIGLGSIGLALAVKAKGLGMEVASWSRSLTAEKAKELDIRFCATPNDLAKTSDAVSVHIAASKGTAGLIGAEFFGAMIKNALFVNTSRGEVVVTTELKKAIKEKGIRAAIDVFENEPSAAEAPFADTELAGLVSAASPHIGASTDQAEEAIADETVRIVKIYSETGTPINSVNFRKKSSGTTLVVRHFNKVGVLAGILDLLREEGINIEEMANTIFEGEAAASCSLSLDRPPSETLLASIRKGANVIQASLKN
jgi:D-3-phosphoglycerate dehydrogenase